MTPPNRALLQQINRNGVWFAARKTVPVWARRVTAPEVVASREGDLQAKVGDFVCRGIAGEFWVQTEPTLRAKYGETGQTSLDDRGLEWTEFAPLPESSRVMAAEVGHPFEVHSSWGVLSGKEGDYLLKAWRDRDVEFPADVWTVDREVFQTTYARV